ncbi:chitobiase/beta-hexosaminidase C-terminal domain-containing protein [Psychromonas hadalis]|uniref:chitobiase/beta-hexosaminidase C-terminal domain-containing protein n=1 Tax=Psychromonas hadalis TaxID=211669 RepID=UPI0024815D88|nr:chitobiase/beta-hexosaminidase C-terminal domain-containing protein [Psychromonas hadalis]
MGKRIQQRAADWEVFAHVIGHKELAKLDAANIIYRLPVPGAIINKGKLEANVSFPGLTIEYSNDGKVWEKYNHEQQPTAKVGILVRSISATGRAGRSVTVK